MTAEVSADARVALVTGASRGIGAGIAAELIRRGHRVACGYRSDAGFARELASRTSAPGTHLHPVRFDLTGDHAGQAAVRAVLDRWGRLDTLVCNAGLWHGGKLVDVDPGDWWQVVEANLKGNASLIRAALPALAESGKAGIVLVSSVVGLIGFPGDTAYASAKAAMIGFARSLAKEVASAGIRVNVLAPGFIDTDMTAAVRPGARRAITEATLLDRFGTIEEIARAAVFLAEDATYCTGAVLTADGGWSI
ncbi:SDR family NAD(P)-dependent oxidoreductase [Prauserella muralis]|uniref:3-oxoacyl-ACP reductase n=1 Tax=Prauserella muralis TaxID=588067 RepID=A0A2V4ATT2_9PSEU|nr:SDR family oxidoreductase [Prauserella muralis]PXY18957.1 3-oxoacyl-ACP reductase [Prauserella muralis]TWE28841.1 3-oxoacyl-[acyl-carrier protein] reductase [Prauserella muralis]